MKKSLAILAAGLALGMSTGCEIEIEDVSLGGWWPWSRDYVVYDDYYYDDYYCCGGGFWFWPW